MQDLAQVLRVDMGNGRHVADVIGWEIEAAHVPGAIMEGLADQYGVDRKLLPKVPDHETTYRRIMRTALSRGWLLRPVQRTGRELLWALVYEQTDTQASRVRHRQVAALRYHKDLDLLDVQVDEDDVVAQEARKQANALAMAYDTDRDHLITDDLTVWLTGLIRGRWQGFSLRRHGGAYVVLAQHADEVRRVKRMVEHLPAAMHEFNLLPQVDSSDTIEAMRREAQHSLIAELADMRREVDGFDPNTVRASTLAARVDACKEVRAKLALYEGVLGTMQADLAALVGKLEDKVDALLGLT